jgi:Animal haem peroxidase
VPGFWLGLGMMQTLFVQEHNAICDRLHADYTTWSDDKLFNTARLINSALVGKIHTVNWSPTVVGHPTSRLGLHTDWWGLAGEKVHNRFGRISNSRLISGALGSQTEHFGVPFTITEEFVAIYRMHQMVPDNYSIRSVDDDRVIQESRLRDLSGPWALDALRKLEMRDLLYSFGTMNAGLVTLHNYPNDLQEFERPDGKLMDLAATEVLRTRELGLPRYNEFRRLLHLEPAKDFESLTDNPIWAQEMRDVYHGDIEQLDLLIGMYAEKRPPGFAFSDTAFHLFILTAPRRLSSDRFYSRDCRPEVYTPAGMDWIEHNSMGTILLRHYPELRRAMGSPKNAFAPWVRSTV